MALTAQEVRRVADLARLELTAEEAELFARQLGRVVEYIDQLARFETAPVEVPRFDAAAAADVPEPCLPAEAALANAPRSFDGFVAVPRVLEDDD